MRKSNMGVSATTVVVLCIFLVLGMVLAGVIFQPKSSLDVWNVSENDYPKNSSPEERLTYLINYAILAPSIYNSQPWKFNVSDDEILVSADQSRWLNVADKDRRELYMSLGCAIENLVIAAEHFGYNCSVSYFPDKKDLVAAVYLNRQSEARSSLNQDLFEAITSRRTCQQPFESRTISKQDLYALNETISNYEASIFLTDDPSTKNEFRNLVIDADEALYSDIDFKSELGRWLGQGVMGPSGVNAKIAQMEMAFLDPRPEQIRKDADLINSTPFIGFISTRNNDSISALKAGRALERFWLAAAARGISLQPMSQALVVPETKEEIAGLLPAADAREVQQAFRLGYCSGDSAHSNRRPLEDALEKD
jgi:nitroreductase